MTHKSLVAMQLMSLVRQSLWSIPVERNLYIDFPVGWDAIGRMAMEQTVGILVFEAALSLPEDLLPPKEWIRKAYAIIERNRRTHSLLDQCVVEVVSKLKGVGIEPLLLKGQAYARAYPSPTFRQCGDIDIYVGNENYYTAYQAVNRFGWECEKKFIDEAKHYGCKLNGVRIELHRLAGILPTYDANRKFQDWSRKQLSLNQTVIEIGGKMISVPSPIFTVIFVFMHMYLHFLNGGIGLRHVCDWIMLLHAFHKEIDLNELKKLLKEFRLLRGWCLFTPIAVDYLGLPKSECPFYTDQYSKQSHLILSSILKEGNFGRASRDKSKRPEGYLAGKIHSFRMNSIRLKSKVKIDPHIILLSYNSYILRGLKRVLEDLLSFRNKE